jgi:hypothetical protein
MDAKTAGLFHSTIKGTQSNIPGYSRRIIANDVKMLAQISNKNIGAIISKDVNSIRQYVSPLEKANLLQIYFFDLNTPLKNILGTLF